MWPVVSLFDQDSFGENCQDLFAGTGFLHSRGLLDKEDKVFEIWKSNLKKEKKNWN